ncbi:MAG: hypothetical protein ACFFBD_16635 [Candidatus Hodarchaeota archaeon]
MGVVHTHIIRRVFNSSYFYGQVWTTSTISSSQFHAQESLLSIFLRPDEKKIGGLRLGSKTKTEDSVRYGRPECRGDRKRLWRIGQTFNRKHGSMNQEVSTVEGWGRVVHRLLRWVGLIERLDRISFKIINLGLFPIMYLLCCLIVVCQANLCDNTQLTWVQNYAITHNNVNLHSCWQCGEYYIMDFRTATFTNFLLTNITEFITQVLTCILTRTGSRTT